ncbi:uncharacterized protein LY89DRAFT_50453 [Mollisia scopiformis]|uniref:Uncharacterized protein n=1 Tax=Mollisia scopiformis TaxID=149040 RepID=A0A194XC28_MOLSC|nr:uncharacterized protein LY89DRAFT_50453 [Mollisia scopiformis]KUJ17307.1 hypothetical protein LY89DRAFT_50453 [Mollisia scopiformis]
MQPPSDPNFSNLFPVPTGLLACLLAWGKSQNRSFIERKKKRRSTYIHTGRRHSQPASQPVFENNRMKLYCTVRHRLPSGTVTALVSSDRVFFLLFFWFVCAVRGLLGYRAWYVCTDRKEEGALVVWRGNLRQAGSW